jgi:peptide/nickel transport system substrate-binding protein
VFSFQTYLDPNIGSPQRDLLVVDGVPVRVTKVDALTVRFEFQKPYAAAERLFDSVAILPRHLLDRALSAGNPSAVWTLSTPPAQIAGLGPFRLKSYLPGQRIVLERNPYYWKADRKGGRLPYLDTLIFLVTPGDDAQFLRFQAGESDLISRLSAENFALLLREREKNGCDIRDAGPGLEYNFLLFNLNDDTGARLPAVERKQAWFRDLRFRQAVSLAIDREAIVRLVYGGRATGLGGFVTPGVRLWISPAISAPKRSLQKSRDLLRAAGFSWNAEGALIDASGQHVEFSILASASNSQRQQMATLISDDLAALGMKVRPVPMEFRAQIDRIMQTHDYEAAMMAISSGDVDPTSDMNVWLSSGSTHLWHLGEKTPATPWEAEIDSLMRKQESTVDSNERRRLFNRVQQLVADNLPIIPLASPHILVAARRGLRNFAPGILEHYTLANADELYWARP